MLPRENNYVGCSHESYCALATEICASKNICRMKETDIEDMLLMKCIKERVQRDNEREIPKSMYP